MCMNQKMSLIGGKLKPRIKPRLGRRSTGGLPNQPQDENSSVLEPEVPVLVQDKANDPNERTSDRLCSKTVSVISDHTPEGNSTSCETPAVVSVSKITSSIVDEHSLNYSSRFSDKMHDRQKNDLDVSDSTSKSVQNDVSQNNVESESKGPEIIDKCTNQIDANAHKMPNKTSSKSINCNDKPELNEPKSPASLKNTEYGRKVPHRSESASDSAVECEALENSKLLSHSPESSSFLNPATKPGTAKRLNRMMKVTPNISRRCKPTESNLKKSTVPSKIVESDSSNEENVISSTVKINSTNPESNDVFVNENGESVRVIDISGDKIQNFSNSCSPDISGDTFPESSTSCVAQHGVPSSKSIKEGTLSSTQTAKSPEKTERSTKEDVKMLCAVSAIDYLRRHDHALGDSILRRIIVGSSKLLDKSLRPSTCPSCNPQTLRKCLVSLSSYDKDGLQLVLKKSAERQKTAITYSNFPGKSSFKPSLGRQRAPTLTTSTYGKMSYEVKEGLSKKYGTTTPELSKLRMLDLIFYNPSNSPMTNSTVKDTSQSDLSKGKECINSSSSQDPASTTTLESDENNDKNENSSSSPNDSDLGVPRVRIGDDGQIILAPESLVVRTQEPDVLEGPVHHDFGFSNPTKQDSHRLAWNFEETMKFYKALHSIGTDFTSMLEVFPNRTRKNLKAKFKREERKNPSLVDKVLSFQGRPINIADIERDLSMDKTLRRLCAEASRCKKKQENSVANIIRKNGRKRKSQPSCDERAEKEDTTTTIEIDEGIVSDQNERTVADSPVLETPLSDDNEVAKQCTKMDIDVDINDEKNENNVEITIENNEKNVETVNNRKTPTVPLKKRRVKNMPNLPRKKRRTKAKETVKVIHILNTENSSEDESICIDSSPTPAIQPNCVVIQANIQHEEFKCSRSIKLNIDDPDCPLEINETIEHTSSATGEVEMEQLSSPEHVNGFKSELIIPLDLSFNTVFDVKADPEEETCTDDDGVVENS